ncbi:hypothetical protein ACFP3U_22650 [Kitasatospora misakiensis]|uniref:Uncharacterized protein n=1 Tax=Kitasatospora misakiensis TaxID=67330 RepID=A0ABW0XB51_9ACTN
MAVPRAAAVAGTTSSTRASGSTWTRSRDRMPMLLMVEKAQQNSSV